MTTRRSSFDFDFDLARVRPFVRNTLRTRRGAMLFYSILVCLVLPVQYALEIYRCYRNYSFEAGARTWYERMLGYMNGPAECYNAISAIFLTFLIFLVPVAISISLYSYMHNRRMVDVYHSLPLTREELFIGNSIVAVIIMWVPLVINYVITAAMSAFVPTARPLAILGEMLFSMVIMLSIYAICSFVATQIGTALDQLMYTGVVSFSVFGVLIAMEALCSGYLYGYSSYDSFYEITYMFNPFAMMIRRLSFYAKTTNLAQQKYFIWSNWSAAAWFVIAVFVIVASAALYKRRKSEQAEVVGNLGSLQVFARAVGTILGGFAGGWVITAVFSIDSSFGFVACVFVASMLTYYVGDVILTRSIRRPKRMLPAALATVAVACLMCSSVVFDFFGYEKRVPTADEVMSIELNNLSTRYSDQLWYKTGDYSRYTVRERETIEQIIALHEKQTVGEDKHRGYNMLYITYNMKDGSTMRRRYYSLNPDAYELLLELETNDEILKNTAAVFKMEVEDIVGVSAENMLGSYKESLNLTEAEKARLLEALRQDMLDQKSDEFSFDTEAVVTLCLSVYDDRDSMYSERVYETTEPYVVTEKYYPNGQRDISHMYYMVTESFTRTLAVLRDAGFDASLENDPARLDMISLWLYHRNSNGVISVAYPGNAPSTRWEFWEEDDGTERRPLAEITHEEYSTIKTLGSYLTNDTRVEDNNTYVAVLYYNSRFSEPCGWHYTELSELPAELQTRVLKAYQSYHGFTDEDMRNDFPMAAGLI